MSTRNENRDLVKALLRLSITYSGDKNTTNGCVSSVLSSTILADVSRKQKFYTSTAPKVTSCPAMIGGFRYILVVSFSSGLVGCRRYYDYNNN